MNNERRKYPRVEIDGEVNIQIAGVIRKCRHQLIEQMAKFKSDAGLFPDFELEFSVPNSKEKEKTIKSTCNVSDCRRLSQDMYHLGLNFVTLSASDEKKVTEYISHG
ncbi:MAG: PilZ domain-containing protein [Gammaproteobacteria bacterium]|nr:PilZ domain-containing protein [Gammaproteobacteria bacterium]MDD9896925.1 PilZ domain-containing protein [Gammaproteobacteria bacterium]MDD9959057.1 PilZ domain-containing protein [Gammaproteobacteria bacterium]